MFGKIFLPTVEASNIWIFLLKKKKMCLRHLLRFHKKKSLFKQHNVVNLLIRDSLSTL